MVQILLAFLTLGSGPDPNCVAQFGFLSQDTIVFKGFQQSADLRSSVGQWNTFFQADEAFQQGKKLRKLKL
jgi:hypothetical protein